MKFDSRQQYLSATDTAWTKLWSTTNDLSDRQLVKRVRLQSNGPARSPKDALAHLYAWHVLLLDWYRTGLTRPVQLPAAGFNWRQTRELNQLLHDRHTDAELASVRRKLKLSHGRVVKLVESLSDKALFEPGSFDWTGKLPLISYVAPNTVSHYRWATAKIKALTG